MLAQIIRNRLDSAAKLGRDSSFFAASEVSLSAEGGDSPREQEKSRISVINATQLFRLVRGLGDSWSNSIRAAADTK